jgi:hypothetical protein
MFNIYGWYPGTVNLLCRWVMNMRTNRVQNILMSAFIKYYD